MPDPDASAILRAPRSPYPMTAARRLLAPLIASTVAFVATTVAAALPPGVTQGPSVEGITEYTLANGLTVLLFPDASEAEDDRQRHLPGRLAPRELRRDRHGAPARAHDVQGHADLAATSRPSSAKRGMRFNGSTWYDRTNYFESFNASPENLAVGARDGSRPHGQLVHRTRRPRQRDDRGAQRVRERREQSRSILLRADARHRLRVAQLRQGDDRRALRHRERRHRAAAGVLPHVLPAGQRGADRRRQVRSRRDARLDRASTSARSRSRRARCRASTPRSPCRTASAR